MAEPALGPSRARRAITLAVQIALGAAGLWLLASCSIFTIRLVQPAFLRNALDVQLINVCTAEGGRSCNLIPSYLTLGQSREEVVAIMAKAGYSHHPVTDVPYAAEDPYTDFFGKDAGITMLFMCSLDLRIWMIFDEDGHLMDTLANSAATCL